MDQVAEIEAYRQIIIDFCMFAKNSIILLFILIIVFIILKALYFAFKDYLY